MNVFDLSDAAFREAAKQIRKENKFHPVEMRRLPDSSFESQKERSTKPLIEVWRSRFYLCQIYAESEDVERISICQTILDTANRRWRDGMTWDDLRLVKFQVGRGDLDAVEIYPAEKDVVNVANMRHLWVFKKEPFALTWRKK